MIKLSAVQSSARTFIHNAILFIDTSNNAWYSQVNKLIRAPYLSTITSNELEENPCENEKVDKNNVPLKFNTM